MKRFGMAFAGMFLALMVAGCGGGIEEGPPKDGPTDPQPPAFKEFMKQNAGKMANQKKPTAPPKAETEPEKPQ